MDTIMCIGGPWHGQLISVYNGTEYFRVPLDDDVTMVINSSAPPHPPTVFKVFEYRREAVFSTRRFGWKRTIFIPAGISNQDEQSLYRQHLRLLASL